MTDPSATGDPEQTHLLDRLFTSPALSQTLGDEARLQAMLNFEAALARAQAHTGVIPSGAARSIAAHCRAEYFDRSELARATEDAGNPAIPLVKALTARVREADREAAGYVHWGATSQDTMDTGLVLQLRQALDSVSRDLDALDQALATLADRQRHTVLAGRTWMQQALPVTLGLKAAGWLSAVRRQRRRLVQLRPRLLVIQLGGAAGTLASLGEHGPAVAAALAEELDLAVPTLPWHTQRDTLAELGTWFGLLTGSLGKMARDIALLMQTEVGEVLEPAAPGRGGSSTMPHKRNPTAAASVLSAAQRVPGLVSTLLIAMVQEHERGLGGWHAEWETLPDIIRLGGGALARMRKTVEGLEIRADAMADNLDVTHGLIMAEAVMMALAPRLGRAQAHERVGEACRKASREGRHLRQVIAEDEQLSGQFADDEIDRLFVPAYYLGAADEFIDQVLHLSVSTEQEQ